jgi:hypothetical protein
MADLETVTSDSREAVGAFLTAARAVPESMWRFGLRPILRRGAFGKPGRAPEPLRPGVSPPPQDALTARLQSASAALQADLAAAARTGQTTVDHPFFGRLPLADLLRLQVIHTRHHRRQLPGVTG